MPEFTVLILKGNKQHSSCMNSAIERKEEAMRREIKLVPTSDTVAVLVVPICLHHWLTKPTLSGMKGPNLVKTQEHLHQVLELGGGKGEERGVRTHTTFKHEVHLSTKS